MIHVLALLGLLCISFSAVFVRLASVSPVTATFFRAADAIPILAIDLNLWHESIALVGAGLGTGLRSAAS